MSETMFEGAGYVGVNRKNGRYYKPATSGEGKVCPGVFSRPALIPSQYRVVRVVVIIKTVGGSDETE